MLSILIPVYDYNAFPLAAELHQQCIALHIPFEILCQDDASTTYITENQTINTLENGTFSSNVFNLGRGRNCNALAKKAAFDWLLILDCDTFPKDADFIKNFLYPSLISVWNFPFLFSMFLALQCSFIC